MVPDRGDELRVGMDFQELLSIAAENNKKAKKEVDQRKRYSTAVPPPKKVTRTVVDKAAIQARLQRKQDEIRKKASQEEAKKQQLLKLREESKKKPEKPSAKQPTNGRRKSDADAKQEKYKGPKHEERHQSFLKKVEIVAERSRKEEVAKPVSKTEVSKLKKAAKKPAGSQKGPLSYEQLLALAANQQGNGGSGQGQQSEAKPKASRDGQAGHRPSAAQARSQEEMRLKKAAAARKLAGSRPKESADKRRDVTPSQTHSRKPQIQSTNTATTTTNGVNSHKKVAADSRSAPAKRVTETAVKRSVTVTTVPPTSTAKTKPSTSAGHRSNGNHSKDADRRRQAPLKQSRVQEYFEKRPGSDQPRQRPRDPPPPMRQSRLDVYCDSREPSTSRAPSMGSKRPAGSPPASFRAKFGRLMSDEESDYEDDGFIDDTPLDDGEKDVSSYIKEIFGYDKSKYGYESDYQLRNMDASYRDIQREEARSARLGMQEDLEDIRQEREEKKRLKMKMASKQKAVAKRKR